MKIGLLGYGKMGRGLFSLAAGAELPITVYVRSAEKAEKLNQQIDRRIQRALRGGEIDAAAAARLRADQRFTPHLADLAACDLIVESIVEEFDQKTALLRELDPHLRPDAMVASNTSTFSIAALAAVMTRPERFAGFHLFHPVTLTPLIEILTWENALPETIDRLAELARRLGKTPLVFRDTPGSAINSILACFYCEGLYILEQGLALPSQVDKLAAAFCRIGPCESLDVIGLPFFTESFERMADYRPPQLTTPTLLHRLLAAGRHGKAAGRGVFLYERDIPCDDAPEAYRVPEQRHSAPAASSDPETLRRRLLYAICCGVLFNLSRRLGAPADMDRAAAEVLGMDRSPFAIMRSLGRERLAADFARLGREVGFRFDPALLDLLPDLPETASCP
jgi:3-hydroxybutyryl-CoA dehydrogenase